MRFNLLTILAGLTAIATAQNPFLYNPGDLTNITAGSSFDIKWAPSTGTQDTVTILLRQGNPDQLVTVLTIAGMLLLSHVSSKANLLFFLPRMADSNLVLAATLSSLRVREKKVVQGIEADKPQASIVNTGSYTWAVPSTLVNGPLYTFEIRDDLNNDLANYSNTFSISSTNTVSSIVAAPVSTITTNGHVTTVYAVATQSVTSATGTSTATGSAVSGSATAKSEGMRNVKLGGAMLGVVAGVVVAL
ncbi:uncharacterized protein PAC_04107 [Phialocephala subalpina]|uniref:Yeast cell wall synthesis Kre9/Knh1-like N-terminal domain-containing protein n=1 Tax=Phialocephala subalpina TaxID=576137 RepID=A0A1L7WN66_9HELO|nr:uncharacterized protein PAC_04107 [Phialocephala subalpina]